MNSLGKIVTAGIAVVTGTSLLTGVTTAYILRSEAPAAPMTAATYTPTPVHRAAPAVMGARVVPAVSRTTADTPRAVPVASNSSQCDTGTDRALRIAKPGVIGALLGAGLGAAGGAIADGGSGAGKGALIGGLVGVATGAGYGAYKTNNECGTIFGNRGLTNGAPGVSQRGPMTEAALQPSPGNDITIYSAR
jgi:hypothetical protein